MCTQLQASAGLSDRITELYLLYLRSTGSWMLSRSQVTSTTSYETSSLALILKNMLPDSVYLYNNIPRMQLSVPVYRPRDDDTRKSFSLSPAPSCRCPLERYQSNRQNCMKTSIVTESSSEYILTVAEPVKIFSCRDSHLVSPFSHAHFDCLYLVAE